jgi:hypothetical protein
MRCSLSGFAGFAAFLVFADGSFSGEMTTALPLGRHFDRGRVVATMYHRGFLPTRWTGTNRETVSTDDRAGGFSADPAPPARRRTAAASGDRDLNGSG